MYVPTTHAKTKNKKKPLFPTRPVDLLLLLDPLSSPPAAAARSNISARPLPQVIGLNPLSLARPGLGLESHSAARAATAEIRSRMDCFRRRTTSWNPASSSTRRRKASRCCRSTERSSPVLQIDGGRSGARDVRAEVQGHVAGRVERHGMDGGRRREAAC